MTSQYDNMKIIPQPASIGSTDYKAFERIRDTLPDKTNQAGKYLKVSADEEHAEWSDGGGGGSQIQSDWGQTDNTQVDFIKRKPEALSEFTNDEGFQTASDVGTAVAAHNNSNTAHSDIRSALSSKVDKDGTKQLSDENFTSAYKQKLDGVDEDANTQMLSALSSVSVPASAWTLQSTPDVAGYPYRAGVTYTGLTSTDYVSVIFNQTDAMSGKFANVCQSASGEVYVYAKEQPTTATVIETVQAWRKS